MDTKFKEITMLNVLCCLLITPLIIIKSLFKSIKISYYKIKFRYYTYDNYQTNKIWVPKLINKNRNNEILGVALGFLIFVLINFLKLKFLILESFLAFLFFVYLIYVNNSKSEKLLHLYQVKKNNYQDIEKIDIYLENKIADLYNYFKPNNLAEEIDLFNHFINLLLLYISDTEIREELSGFKDLINNHYHDLMFYYSSQNNYLNSLVKANKEKILVNKSNINIEKTSIIYQGNKTRELFESFLQCKAIFNAYIRDNIVKIFAFDEPLSVGFFKYLEESRIFTNVIKQLPLASLFNLLEKNILTLNIYQVKEIININKDVLILKTTEGNTLLHLSVLAELIELTAYILSFNVDVNLTNNKGLTPYCYAREKNNLILVNLFKKYSVSDEIKTIKVLMKDNNKFKKIKQEKPFDYELHINNKLSELKYYIDLRKLEKEHKKINQFIDWCNFYKSDSVIIDEVNEFKSLINSQFREIRKYYQNQLNYLNSYLICLKDNIDNQGNILFSEKLKKDPELINQSNYCRELCDSLMQYTAIFNSFVRDNLVDIINIKQPLCLEFINYLESSRIIDALIKKLNKEDLFDFLTINLLRFTTNQITTILISRNELLEKKNHDGNTLLDIAVINRQDDLVNFLQGYDNNEYTIKTFVV